MTDNARKGLDAVVLSSLDNLATALRHLKTGEQVRFKVDGADCELQMTTDVALCHKFTICDVNAGDLVHKYGEVIGAATADIPSGAHAHVHNIRSLRASST